MHEVHYPINNLNDGATIFANVAPLLTTSCKILCADVDSESLQYLTLRQRSLGACEPHQNLERDMLTFFVASLFDSRNDTAVSKAPSRQLKPQNLPGWLVGALLRFVQAVWEFLNLGLYLLYSSVAFDQLHNEPRVEEHALRS